MLTKIFFVLPIQCIFKKLDAFYNQIITLWWSGDGDVRGKFKVLIVDSFIVNLNWVSFKFLLEQAAVSLTVEDTEKIINISEIGVGVRNMLSLQT